MKAIDLFYLALFRLFRALVVRLAPKKRVALAQKLATLAWYAAPSRRRVIETNLEIAFPDRYDKSAKKRIGIASYTNFIMNLFTVMRMPFMSEKELLDSVDFENEEIIQKAIDEGLPILFITAHYGNWELMPAAVTLRYGLGGAVVGRRLDSEAVNEELIKSRRHFGIDLIYKKGAVKGAIKALKPERYIGILTDQSLPQKYAVPVKFFGKKAGHTPLVGMLARRKPCVVIPIRIHTRDHLRYSIRFYPPLPRIVTDDAEADIQKMAQDQADAVAKMIEEDPALWFWPHKRWKTYDKTLYRKAP